MVRRSLGAKNLNNPKAIQGGRERLIVEAHRYGGLAPSTGKPTTSMSFGRVALARMKIDFVIY